MPSSLGWTCCCCCAAGCGCSVGGGGIISSGASCCSASRSQSCAMSRTTARSLSREILRASSRHSCARRRYCSALLRVKATPSLVAYQNQHSEGLCGSKSGQPKFQKGRGELEGTKLSSIGSHAGHGDFAREPLRAPREANPAPELIGDHLFHHALDVFSAVR